MKPTRDEALTALGLDPARATFDNIANAIEAHVETARNAADPAVIAALVGDVRTRLKEKFSEGGIDVLAADAADRVIAAETQKWQQHGRDAHRRADAAWDVARAELDARIARQKVLTRESEAPAGSRQEQMLARLVDLHEEAEAEQWIAARGPVDALKRYAASDDTSERTLARVIERRFTAGVLDVSAAPDPLAIARQFRDAIEARQQARVRPSDLDASARLDRLRADLDRYASTTATTPAAIGRTLAAAGKPGAVKPIERPKTPGNDDGTRREA